MSLSFMRRDRDTPNGLMEFLVVRAIELLRRARGRGGVAQLRRLRAAASAAARRARARARPGSSPLGNPFFQIESLYRFNAKFFPRWEPRYLVYERRRWLPRVGLAALRIEGQLPKPWA